MKFFGLIFATLLVVAHAEETLPGKFIEANYLLWGTHEDGSDFIARKLPYPGEFEDYEFGWTSGVRAGVGYYWNEESFTRASYLYYGPHASNSRSCTLTPTYIPQFQIPFQAKEPTTAAFINYYVNTPPTFTSARASSDINYHFFDWIVSKQFFVNRWFDFSAQSGIVGAVIDQDLDITYKGLTEYSTPPPAVETIYRYTIKVNDDWRFGGGGLKVGGIGKILFGKGIFARLDGFVNLLLGKYQLHVKHTSSGAFSSSETGNDLSGAIAIRNAFDNFYTVSGTTTFWRIRALLELSLNVGWSKLHNNGHLLEVTAGYDLKDWIHLNQFRRGLHSEGIGRFTNGSNQTFLALSNTTHSDNALDGNLSIHGFNLRVMYKF